LVTAAQPFEHEMPPNYLQPGDWSQSVGGISMLEWLRRRHQTKGAIERFWRVVLVSALDEELDKTTLAMASMFFGKRSFPIAPDTAWVSPLSRSRTLRRLQVRHRAKGRRNKCPRHGPPAANGKWRGNRGAI